MKSNFSVNHNNIREIEDDHNGGWETIRVYKKMDINNSRWVQGTVDDLKLNMAKKYLSITCDMCTYVILWYNDKSTIISLYVQLLVNLKENEHEIVIKREADFWRMNKK